MSRIIATLTPVATLFLLLGCHDATNANWAKTVPGHYVGVANGMKEIIVLNTNGQFQHGFYFQQQKLIDETGQWKFDINSGMIQVSPFTSFYHTDLARMTTTGVARVSDEIGVLRNGKSAPILSQGMNFEFSLHKQSTP